MHIQFSSFWTSNGAHRVFVALDTVDSLQLHVRIHLAMGLFRLRFQTVLECICSAKKDHRCRGESRTFYQYVSYCRVLSCSELRRLVPRRPLVLARDSRQCYCMLSFEIYLAVYSRRWFTIRCCFRYSSSAIVCCGRSSGANPIHRSVCIIWMNSYYC